MAELSSEADGREKPLPVSGTHRGPDTSWQEHGVGGARGGVLQPRPMQMIHNESESLS